jgi:hypothetical protein
MVHKILWAYSDLKSTTIVYLYQTSLHSKGNPFSSYTTLTTSVFKNKINLTIQLNSMIHQYCNVVNRGNSSCTGIEEYNSKGVRLVFYFFEG